MCKHAVRSQSNKGCKVEVAVFILTFPFSKQKFVVHFSNVICMKTRPLYLLYEKESLQHCLSYDFVIVDKWQRFQFLRSGFSNRSVFQGVHFFVSPEFKSRSKFQTMLRKMITNTCGFSFRSDESISCLYSRSARVFIAPGG